MGKGASKDVDPQYLVPSGKLYERCEWEPRVLKNMILSKKLSPFFPPLDTKLEGSEECPICMMVRITVSSQSILIYLHQW